MKLRATAKLLQVAPLRSGVIGSQTSTVDMKKPRTTQAILVVIIALLLSCNSEPPRFETVDSIDVMAEPVQTAYRGDPIRKTTRDGGDLRITPLAEYRISAVVNSRKHFSSGWRGQVSPVDLNLIWGKLTLPEYDKHITYRHGNRRYHFRYDSDFPDSKSYITTHSCNAHIIPADRGTLAAIKSLKKQQKVRLEGLLVRADLNYESGKYYWWSSSLGRSDDGDGSCEVFYVEKVILEKDSV